MDSLNKWVGAIKLTIAFNHCKGFRQSYFIFDSAHLLSNYQEIIEKVISDYANFLGDDDGVQNELVFDQTRDRYLLIEAGWKNGRRTYGTLLHQLRD